MTPRSAAATIVASTLFLATVGASAGYALGTFAPAYYRSVFRSGREPGFDPVQVGIGQGLTQGLAGGVAVGLALVALFVWRDGRSHARTAPPPPGATARLVLFAVVSAAALGFGLCAGGFGGRLLGLSDSYHLRFLEEREALAPLLASDRAFTKVELVEASDGGYLTGEVPTADDLDRLRTGVTRAVGERRAMRFTENVRVRR